MCCSVLFHSAGFYNRADGGLITGVSGKRTREVGLSLVPNYLHNKADPELARKCFQRLSAWTVDGMQSLLWDY